MCTLASHSLFILYFKPDNLFADNYHNFNYNNIKQIARHTTAASTLHVKSCITQQCRIKTWRYISCLNKSSFGKRLLMLAVSSVVENVVNTSSCKQYVKMFVSRKFSNANTNTKNTILEEVLKKAYNSTKSKRNISHLEKLLIYLHNTTCYIYACPLYIMLSGDQTVKEAWD